MSFRLPLFSAKDRALGVSEKHSYDIPLDQGSGRIFLILLISLMVFLACLSISGAFTLTQFANRWQTGLEGKWTIELPAITASGGLIKRSDLRVQAEKIQSSLNELQVVADTTILSDNDVKELLKPWFDFSQMDETIPLPVLISLTIPHPSPETAWNIETALAEISPAARLDRHEAWLEQLLKLTGTLRLISSLFTIIICGAAITAIAGAIQSRMAEHKDSVQLLHLMGASDFYIMKQFQRHGVIMALQGGTIGMLFAAFLLWLVITYMGGETESLLPKFNISISMMITLVCLPLMAAILAAMTTRFTVLHTLNRMP